MTMKMASIRIDLISKKKNCTCRTLFLLISKKQICTCSTLFFLSLAVVLNDYNAVLYDENVKLPRYTLFLWRNCHMCLPNISFPVFMFAFIFHCYSFSPCWPLAFLIFSPPLWISMFFFLRNSPPLFSVTRSSSFSVIHVSVNIKKKTLKKTRLCCCFLFLKVRAAKHLGCHTCWLSYFTLVYMWCGRTVGPVARSLGVRSLDYQIFSDG